MKILHVINSMAVEEGGPPVVCAGLAGAQARAGHAVTIAAVTTSATAVEVDPLVRLVEHPCTGSRRYLRSAPLAAWLDESAGQFDLACIHTIWQYPTVAAASACHRAGVPYVIVTHGMLDRWAVRAHSYPVKWLYWRMRGATAARQAAALQCLNRAEIDKAIDWVGPLPKLIAPNGIAAEELIELPPRGRFRAPHPEIGARPLVMFLSRLHPKKGLDRLLPAFRRVLERVPDCRLAIAGAGEAAYVAQLDALIAQHGLQSSVQRVGQLKGVARFEALVDADVFVLPSHQEGFSMAITEALGSACPVVITAACNFPEVAERDAGVVIAGDDMNAFADATADLLLDADRRAAMGKRGRKLVLAQYTWERIVAELDEAYRWIVAGRPLRADGQAVWRSTEGAAASGAGASPGGVV